MISAEERMHRENVYRLSWAVVRNLYLHGEINGKVARGISESGRIAA